MGGGGGGGGGFASWLYSAWRVRVRDLALWEEADDQPPTTEAEEGARLIFWGGGTEEKVGDGESTCYE